MKQVKDIRELILAEKDYRIRCQAFKKCSYGDENRYKKFRVLCNKARLAHKQGLLSTVCEVLPNMIEARSHGYIPVVDLRKNSRRQCLLQDPQLAKQENAWEYYFTQPDKDIIMDEVYRSRRVEVQINCCRNLNYYMGDAVIQSSPKTQILRQGIYQNIHLQPKIEKKVLHEKRRLFSAQDKVLGVGIRAGYRWGIISSNKTFNGHPLVGSCTDYIKDIEKKLSEWDYDSFFLAVDDRQYLEEIKKYFGKTCIYFERPRIHYFEDALNDVLRSEEDDGLTEFEKLSPRDRNEDYLVELYLLAQCDGLYASRGTGHNFAYLLNNGRYSHVEFKDLGEFQYEK